MDYKTYLKTWCSNISSEIKFWDTLMKSKGQSIHAEEIFSLRLSDTAPFMLDEEIEHEHLKFLDVGSGPFSRCGILSNKAQIEFTAVDPLAKIYQQLKKKYNLNSPIIPQTGIVENLSDYFKENSFDMIHMSNSLDHCFDPIEGIKQMLMICKIGGKIILRHNENEGSNAKYNGLHQWDIYLHKNKFFISGKEHAAFDIGDIIKDYAIVEKATMAEETVYNDTWIHNKFVIRKRKNLKSSNNQYRKELIVNLLEEVCQLNLKLQP